MEITLATVTELYLATKQAEGKSHRTLDGYRNFLVRFAQHAKPEAKLKEIGVDSAREFVAVLQAQTGRYENHPLHPAKEGGLSPMTVDAHVRTLKAFGSWLADEGFTSSNIFLRLKRPTVPKCIIEILSDEEMRTIIGSINPNSFFGSRQFLIALLLLDTGTRASELCTLKHSDTHLEEGYVKVMGKGSKERIVPISAATKKAIMRYMTTFRPEPQNGADELILANDGSPFTYAGLSHMIRRLGKRSGVERLHLHLFRHTFAVSYLMNGGDVMSLKLILGHTTLDVTQIYMHLAQSHFRVQHARFSPVDRLGITTGKKSKRPRV